uniref:Perilipin n=1 Tax=Sphenodon punctatus TaxID=8508 RepID=A0A8D0H6B3_SPHPU
SCTNYTSNLGNTNAIHLPNVVSRVASLPLVSSAYDIASTAYTSTKENHPYLKSVCDLAEKGVKVVTEAAVSTAQPVLTKLEPQISAVNEYACKGLDKLEAKLPILQLPADKVLSDTKELVSSKVMDTKDAMSKMADMTKQAARSVMASSMSTAIGSRVGQMAVKGADAMLEKSEDLVDHYLPITDEELAKLATPVEGFEVASVQQQQEQQKYFVRLGSLSTKLRHRAYLHSLDKVRQAQQGIQEALSQLHHTIELIEYVKQGGVQKLHDGQEKLYQMWLDWSKKQPTANGKSSEQPETLTLTMTWRLTQQLQTTCLSLVTTIQGLPTNIQDKMQLAYHNLAELHTVFSNASSFQDLSVGILTYSKEKATKAQEYVDELLEYVAHNTHLSWLVGPFTPTGGTSPELQDPKVEAE